MTLIFYKMIAAILIFFVSAITALYPLKKNSLFKHTESLELGEALASGIFLGAAFFHLLPDAIKIFSQVDSSLSYPIPEAICVGGFLLLLFLERFSLATASSHSQHFIPYLLAITLIIHAVVEGAALGIGSTFSEAFLLFIAIIAHKGSESFALCMTMLRQQLPLRHIIITVIFFSLMTPLGISFGATLNQLALVHNNQLLAGIFDAFAAGTFLYISTLHHVHFHRHEQDARGMVEFFCLVGGLMIMGIIAWWV